MAWITPKTDWFGSMTVQGDYVGDYFNITDYNRIKNNLEHLREMAVKVYEEFDIEPMGDDREYKDNIYADEVNLLAANLKTIIDSTVLTQHYYAPLWEFKANDRFLSFGELNDLERSMLKVYESLSNVLDQRRMFNWNFGMKGGVL